MNANLKKGLNYHYDGSELVIEGFDRTNPFIYDNDIFYDTLDIYFNVAMSKLNGGTMKGLVVTYNILEEHIPFQAQLDDAIHAVQRCRSSNMGEIPDPVFGAPGKLHRPASGKIEDTEYTVNDGSSSIIEAAHRYGTAEKPLVVYVGGQPTSVAAAYLQDNSIADKILVCHIDPLGYNGADSWATYICATTMRYFAWGNKLWWWSGTYDNQIVVDPPILADADFDALPDNPLGIYLKTTYKNSWPNNEYHDIGDGAISIYLYARSDFPVVQKQMASYSGVCEFTDTDTDGSAFDVLTVSRMSDDNKRNLGLTFFEIMNNPQVYAD